MAVTFRNIFDSAAALVAAASVLSGCSNAAVSKAVGTAGDPGAAIMVATSESGIIVENHAGRPLLDVRIAIDAVDMAMPFIRVVPTIDSGAKSEMALTDFRNEDGTLLDPASVHPKQVTVTARDTLAKSYEVTLPWTQ
jgi:hypothetical protein